MDSIDRVLEFVDSVEYQGEAVGDLKKSHVKAAVRHTVSGKTVMVRGQRGESWQPLQDK